MNKMTISQFHRWFLFDGSLGGLSGVALYAMACQLLSISISWSAMPWIFVLCGGLYLIAQLVINELNVRNIDSE
ncbi:hypothetical protein K4H28_03450 [Deefgea tanakiae]|uniref:Uncharacterized protein n=1 Tax=Deefgea tanakiae TaxID=2865840 RepID=A0ABX8ZC92_9NEIS|nr:hypothetical protein [Deefgea tanakiae]QZA78484.1 hypothetical protein K4H28_03450 [Deefgea tanakiae]